MVSQEHKEKLRRLAFKRGFGGKNAYANARDYSTDELEELAKKYNDCKSTLTSLFGEKKKIKSYVVWKNDLHRHMSHASYLQLLLLVEPSYCRFCQQRLDASNYVTTKPQFKMWCKSCQDKELWKRKEYRPKEGLESVSRKSSARMKALMNGPEADTIKRNIGEKNSANMKAFNQTERGKANIAQMAKKNSIRMKEKIRAGEFTPCITNTWTHWNAQIEIDKEIKKFRSSWEACFWLCNPHLLYEHVRIPYKSQEGEDKVYIADFFDPQTNSLYEIKPISQYNDNADKLSQVIDWCLLNQFKFIWLNENNIMSYIDVTKFTGNNIRQLNKMMKGVPNAAAQYQVNQDLNQSGPSV